MKTTNINKNIIGLIVIMAVGIIVHPLYASAKKDNTNNVTKPVSNKPVAVNSGKNDEEIIIAWDPFVDFIQMRQEMNNILNDSFNSYITHQGPQNMISVASPFTPACDLQEQNGSYVVSMDLPGMDKSNINITVSGRMLNISGRREKIIEEKEGNKIIRQERTQGVFERSIELPTPVIQDKINAEYKNGVLTVTLPPAEPKKQLSKIHIK
jgi:HSP20 family protein